VGLDLSGDPRSATVSALLHASGVVKSSSEGRRAIDQGGVSLNGVRVDGDRQVTAADLLHGRHVLLRKGKRTFAMVRARS
jgi:tyrosyl-tRNA synthetase